MYSKLPDGEHHLLTVKFPLFDKYNEIFGLSGFMKDISEMVRYRQDLIEARKKAESAEHAAGTVPRQYEPRDPHSHERYHRHE